MGRKKAETERTEIYDGICVSGAKGYDGKLSTAVKRRTVNETDGDSFINVRKYNIRGQIVTVRSVFVKNEKRTAADAIRRLIDTEAGQK